VSIALVVTAAMYIANDASVGVIPGRAGAVTVEAGHSCVALQRLPATIRAGSAGRHETVVAVIAARIIAARIIATRIIATPVPQTIPPPFTAPRERASDLRAAVG